MMSRRGGLAVAGAAGLLAGLLLGRMGDSAVSAQAPGASGVNPQEMRLLGNLYMITSGEYRACCLQTYRFAEVRLAERLRCRSNTAKPPAVLMDLDETVFDNAGFQTVLYRNRLVYRDELWEPWERDFPQEVRLVPGAKPFIERAESAGVTVLYMSNRMTRFRESTIRALRHNGLSLHDIDRRLLLKDDTSDKTARRQWACQHYDVLLLVGDNLRDFSEAYRVTPGMTIADRLGLVDQDSGHWGCDWIVLPNSSYGEWEKLLKPAPADHLLPTAMPNPEG